MIKLIEDPDAVIFIPGRSYMTVREHLSSLITSPILSLFYLGSLQPGSVTEEPEELELPAELKPPMEELTRVAESREPLPGETLGAWWQRWGV